MSEASNHGPELLSIIHQLIERCHQDMGHVLDAPDTALESLYGAIRDHFAGKDAAWMEAQVLALLDRIEDLGSEDLESALHKQRERLSTDEPYVHLFLEVLDLAHLQFANAPMMLIANPLAHGRAFMRALSILTKADAATGETRAQLAVAAIKSVVELLYKPYVIKVYLAITLAGGKVVKPPKKLGTAVSLLLREIDDDLIVDRLAPDLRNAAAHEQYRYIPNSDSLELWTKPNQQGKLFVHPVTTLLEKAHWYCDIAEAFHRATGLVMMELLMRNTLPFLLRVPALVRGQLSPEDQAILTREGNDVWSRPINALPKEVLTYMDAGEDLRLAVTESQPVAQ